MSDTTPQAPQGEFVLFQAADGSTRVECRFESDTLWLTQAAMADLYQISPQAITQHIKAVYENGELEESSTCKSYLQVGIEGNREVSRNKLHYSLPVIIAVGYRVRSSRGTQFRKWATATLQEYLIKGFAMDDERLKNPESSVYFEQLLGRIRDIRSSEKVFWRKVCDIYATSTDYDGSAATSQEFFAQVQNKMHWAVHGQTAAEIIHGRVDADKPHLGLTHFVGSEPNRSEIATAKNYLSEQELNLLNRIVTAYLEFAELQAERGRLMEMADWSRKLNDFLTLSERDILEHVGKISAEQAKEKAGLEYERYRKVIDVQKTRVDEDLDKAIKRLPKKKD